MEDGLQCREGVFGFSRVITGFAAAGLIDSGALVKQSSAGKGRPSLLVGFPSHSIARPGSRRSGREKEEGLQMNSLQVAEDLR